MDLATAADAKYDLDFICFDCIKAFDNEQNTVKRKKKLITITM